MAAQQARRPAMMPLMGTPYVAVDGVVMRNTLRQRDNLLQKCDEQARSLAGVQAELGMWRADYRIIFSALKQCKRAYRRCLQQFGELKEELTRLQEREEMLAAEQKSLLYSFLTGMVPDGDPDDLGSVTYAITLVRKDYKKLRDAYIALCMSRQ
jgi:hypothetical protein